MAISHIILKGFETSSLMPFIVHVMSVSVKIHVIIYGSFF